MKTIHLKICLVLTVLLNVTAVSQVPFSQSPDWISSDVSNVSTGAAFADINKDGWLDFIVANGNDIHRQKLVVYYNDGKGNFKPDPDWESSDIDYHGHLSVGDVNGDGFPDVAVSVYIGPSGFGSKGKVKLYLNNNGILSSTPDWVSGDLFYSFSCSFGDANGDGLLDLAVATGESYTSEPEQFRIYLNNNGMLESLPSWKSSDAFYSYDVTWADFDNDGDLDLVFANENFPNQIYQNYGDSIGTTPSWSSTDASKYANSVFVSDVNNDGYLDIAISDNSQLGGNGRFKIYFNNQGVMNTAPSWTSAFSGYGSGIMLADIDNDGFRDLLTGGWWQALRIYMNDNGAFSSQPQLTSNTNSVVEAIVCGDLTNKEIKEVDEIFICSGTRKLFYLANPPLQEILSVIVDSDTLGFDEFCYQLESGWISLANQPDSGAIVTVKKVITNHFDMGITNWDTDIGNYIFYNLREPSSVFVSNPGTDDFLLGQNYPNPFNPVTVIDYSLPSNSFVTLKVYDILGKEVITLVNKNQEAGGYKVEFNGTNLPSGLYIYKLTAGNYTSTKKMMLLR